MTTRQRADLTFKDNLGRGRHGWVRLTPAYSVKVVEAILAQYPDLGLMVDPFSGTGTTGVVASQRGLKCDLFDINPFLVWLAQVKCANYAASALQETRRAADEIMVRVAHIPDETPLWVPRKPL